MIALAKDNKFHSRTKHIDLQYHFIREAVQDGKIMVSYIPTDENVSDVLTKPLTKPKFQHFVEMLGLRESEEDLKGVRHHRIEYRRAVDNA